MRGHMVVTQATAAQHVSELPRARAAAAAATELAGSQQQMRDWMQRIEALTERIAAAQTADQGDEGASDDADSISTHVHPDPLPIGHQPAGEHGLGSYRA